MADNKTRVSLLSFSHRIHTMIFKAAIVTLFIGLIEGLSLNHDQIVFDLKNDPQCPINLPMSCTNSTPIHNSCCFESPGGILLQTQFWDYYPPIGPNDTFTLHGLWPDNCDGSYEQFCNDQLNVREVSDIIGTQFKDAELLNKMKRTWKNFNGNDESLWVHEFNKHATCINTLNPQCYRQDFVKNENVYDFFKITMKLYEKLPTFQFLALAGIEPSTEMTYTKQQISDALSNKFHDLQVYFKCNKYNALQEIWYFHYLQGPIKNEDFVPIASLMHSNCPEEGIKFLPKEGFTPPTPPKQPGAQRGFIKVSNHNGCLISNGQWYQYGTCATYRIVKLQFGSYNIRSSRGVCGVDDSGNFNCKPGNSPARFQFDYDKKTGIIGYGSKDKWCFDYKKKHGSGKFEQIPIKLDDNCEDPIQIKLV